MRLLVLGCMLYVLMQLVPLSLLSEYEFLALLQQ